MVTPTRPWPNPPRAGTITGLAGTVIYYPQWKKWFAWYPVKVNDKLTWARFVYRARFCYREDVYIRHYYKYGTIFDVMTDNGERVV
jgi:hypothetical protein